MNDADGADSLGEELLSSSRPSHPINVIGLSVCVAAHLLADLMVVSGRWFLDSPHYWIAIAFPVGQCSLAAIWAATTQANIYLRFAVPFGVTLGGWCVFIAILPWGVGEPASAAWAIALVIQTLVVFAVVNVCSRMRSTDGKRFGFELRTLILWTVVAALTFCFVQYGRRQWLWTDEIAGWQFFGIVPLYGLFHAAIALAWVWAFADASWRKRGVRAVITLPAVILGGYLFCVFLQSLNPDNAHATAIMVMTIALSTVIAGSLLATLLPGKMLKPQTPAGSKKGVSAGAS